MAIHHRLFGFGLVLITGLALVRTCTAQSMMIDGQITINGGPTSALDYAAWSANFDNSVYVYESTNKLVAGESITCTANAASVGPAAKFWIMNAEFNGVPQTFDYGTRRQSPHDTSTSYTFQSIMNDSGADATVYVMVARQDTDNDPGATSVTVSCTGTVVQTPAPTGPTTAEPTAAPTCACFSETATVLVLEEALVQPENGGKSVTTTTPASASATATKVTPMRDLQVGQKIFTGMDKHNHPIYDTVYSFAHRDVDKLTEYLRIFTANNRNGSKKHTSPIEISSNHLVFLNGRKDPVPAGSLQVGDVLVWQDVAHDNQQEVSATQQPAVITAIQTVRRRGLYAPLTKEGTVVVDSVLSSSYVSIRHLVPRVIGSLTTTNLWSEQTFFHWWMAPYRLFCTHMAPQMCLDDYSEEDGYIHWLVLGRKMAEFAQQSSTLVLALGMMVVLSFCGFFVSLEWVLEKPPSFWVAQLLCGGFLLWSLRECWGKPSSNNLKKHK